MKRVEKQTTKLKVFFLNLKYNILILDSMLYYKNQNSFFKIILLPFKMYIKLGTDPLANSIFEEIQTKFVREKNRQTHNLHFPFQYREKEDRLRVSKNMARNVVQCSLKGGV